MVAPRYIPSGKRGASVRAVHGIVPGSTAHLILLALRGPGGMSSDQLYGRFNGATSASLHRLRAEGLVEAAEGSLAKTVRLTALGRSITAPDGPLSRRKTLNTYCQL